MYVYMYVYIYVYVYVCQSTTILTCQCLIPIKYWPHGVGNGAALHCDHVQALPINSSSDLVIIDFCYSLRGTVPYNCHVYIHAVFEQIHVFHMLTVIIVVLKANAEIIPDYTPWNGLYNIIHLQIVTCNHL